MGHSWREGVRRCPACGRPPAGPNGVSVRWKPWSAECARDRPRAGAHERCQRMRRRAAVPDHQGDCGDHLAVPVVDRGADGQRVEGDLAVADGETAGPDVGEHVPQHVRIGDGPLGVTLDGPGKHLLLHLGRSVREQDEPGPGGGQAEPAADPGEHRDRAGPGDPLDEDELAALPHRELDVLVGDLREVFEKRHGSFTQPLPARRQCAEFPQPQADPVAGVVATLDRAPRDELAEHPVHGRGRQPGLAGEVAQRHRGTVRRERAQHEQRAAQHRPGGPGYSSSAWHELTSSSGPSLPARYRVPDAIMAGMGTSEHAGTGEPLTLYLVKRLELVIRALMDDALRPLGLTTLQYTALSVLAGRGPLSSAQLARRAFLRPQTMHEMVLTLEKRGLLARERHEGNKRILFATLTGKGRALLAECGPAVQEIECALLAEL